MDQFKRALDKYLIAGLLILIGGVALGYGLADGQPGLFLAGATAILIMGVLALLYTFGVLNKMVSMILGVALLLISCVFIYFNTNSITSVLEFRAAKEVHTVQLVQRLKDIRSIELAFKKRYGRYCGDFDSLVHYVKTDSIMILIREGTNMVTFDSLKGEILGIKQFDWITQYDVNGITDSMAFILNDADPTYTFIRDTAYILAYPEVFPNDSATLAARAHPLNLDSLMYIPNMDTATIFLDAGTLNSRGQDFPVFVARERVIYDPLEPEFLLSVGSMEEAKTNGNWTEEEK